MARPSFLSNHVLRFLGILVLLAVGVASWWVFDQQRSSDLATRYGNAIARPLAVELTHEASADDNVDPANKEKVLKTMNKARENHVAMLQTYLRQLDRGILGKYVDSNNIASIRKDLEEIKHELETPEAARDPKLAFEKASELATRMVNNYKTKPSARQIPDAIGLKHEANLGERETKFKESKTSFLSYMGTTREWAKDTVADEAVRLCEEVCMDSRSLFLVMILQWDATDPSRRDKSAQDYLDNLRLVHAATEQLAKNLPAKSEMLTKFAANMARRIEIVGALKEGQYSEVIRLMDKHLGSLLKQPDPVKVSRN